jgi:enoyl-CoA hydratase
VLLAQAVGVRRAKELSTTGNVLDAPTALAWGLVNHVVAHDELLSVTRRIAADISSNDQAGVRRLVQTYDEGALTTGEEAWRNELTIFGEWIRSKADVAGDVEARRGAVMDRGRAQSR